MSVSNGQAATETTFNNAFVSRTANDNTTGKKDLQNADAASGADVINVQREINSNNAFSGRPSGSAHDATPAWTNNDVGSSTDTLKQRADLLTAEFNNTAGHKHTGAVGDGPLIDYTGITSPYRGEVQEAVNLTGVTGLTDDVSAELVLKNPSTSSTVQGVPSTAPYNKVFLRFTTSDDPIEDGSGNQVYGRLTNSGGLGGTWTLTFYSDVAGVETAYSFSGSNNIRLWYQELFHPLSPSGQVYSQEFFVPSDNATADVIDATKLLAGKVSTGAQEFGGEKDFTGGFATESSDVATTATITALTNTTSFVRLTGSTATSVQGITAPASGNSKRLIVSNVSSASVVFAHQNGGASAANRIITPDASDITVTANSSIEFIYDISQSRWIVVSSGVGSGTGGGAYKESVRVVFTTNINLASMPATGDGITLAIGDRFLAAGQTAPAENGPYIFNGAAAAATRSTDVDSSTELVRGLTFYVREGSSYEESIWILNSAGPYTIGTTGLTFVQYKEWNKENLTLNVTDITNQYKDLAFEVVPESVDLSVSGITQIEGTDYTLSLVGLITRVTFAGGLATAGASALISGDILNVQYHVRP